MWDLAHNRSKIFDAEDCVLSLDYQNVSRGIITAMRNLYYCVIDVSNRDECWAALLIKSWYKSVWTVYTEGLVSVRSGLINWGDFTRKARKGDKNFLVDLANGFNIHFFTMTTEKTVNNWAI